MIRTSVNILIILPILLMGTALYAQERGIGVSESGITEENVNEWPYTESVIVTNQSVKEEWVEILIDSDNSDLVTVMPSRFPLMGNAAVRIVVTFDDPRGGNIDGMLRIQAGRRSSSGLTTGTGVEVPFSVSGADAGIGQSAATALAGGVRSVDENIFATAWAFAAIVILLLLSAVARKLSKLI